MKNLSLSLFAIALVGWFSFSSCGDNPNAERAQENMEEAADDMGDALTKERDDLKEDIQEAQSDIDRRLEKLNNDMKEASAEAKAEMQEEINQLEAKKNQLAQDLNEFGNKTEAEWDQFKANVRNTIDKIGDDNDM